MMEGEDGKRERLVKGFVGVMERAEDRENEEGPKQKCNDLIKPLRVIFELSRISSITKVNKQLILQICFRKNVDSQLSLGFCYIFTFTVTFVHMISFQKRYRRDVLIVKKRVNLILS